MKRESILFFSFFIFIGLAPLSLSSKDQPPSKPKKKAKEIPPKGYLFCPVCHSPEKENEVYCKNCASFLYPLVSEKRFYPKGEVSYHYDAQGRLQEKKFKGANSLTIQYSYEKEKLKEESWSSRYYSKKIEYVYLDSGKLLKSKTDGFFQNLTYYFYEGNELVRIVSVGDQYSQIWEYSYDAKSGQRERAVSRIILLGADNQIKFSKVTKWNYLIQKGKLHSAVILETIRYKDGSQKILQGKEKYIYHPKTGKLNEIKVYREGKLIRELYFQK